jgi:hypothetical protein
MTPVTEEEWLACRKPNRMLQFLLALRLPPNRKTLAGLFTLLSGSWSRQRLRKLRLFICACYRRTDLATEHEQERFVQLYERLADGLEQYRIVNSARIVAGGGEADWHERGNPSDGQWGEGSTWNLSTMERDWTAWADDLAENSPAEWIEEGRAQCNLLRDIFGNLFKPYPPAASWPSTVVQLAASLYQGHDCRLPLSDALEESGHQELAEHFRAESWHPKGCWVLDLILNKQ